MYVLIKNSYSSLQYLARSILWIKLLNLLKVLKSVGAESSFQTLTIRTEKKYRCIPRSTYKKRECQCTLKVRFKRCVYSIFLKTRMSSSARMCLGIEFHAAGRACEKARSPNLVLSCGSDDLDFRRWPRCGRLALKDCTVKPARDHRRDGTEMFAVAWSSASLSPLSLQVEYTTKSVTRFEGVAIPTVTFLASKRHGPSTRTKFVCERPAQGRTRGRCGWESNPAPVARCSEPQISQFSTKVTHFVAYLPAYLYSLYFARLRHAAVTTATNRHPCIKRKKKTVNIAKLGDH